MLHTFSMLALFVYQILIKLKNNDKQKEHSKKDYQTTEPLREEN